jgi:hypothetical protein
MGMAVGWLKLANGNLRPTFSPSLTDDRNERDEEERRFFGVAGCSTFVPGMGDYYTIMAKAVGALHPNTGGARQRLYERARIALLTELRSADPSDIMAAQMLLELAIGEVEADVQRDQHARQTMDAPSTAWPPDTEPGREPETVHSRDFAPAEPATA